MEKRILFELVLRAKDTTIQDENTGFRVVEEVAIPIEADWNYEKPDLPPEALFAMTQLDIMHNMSKHFIEKAQDAPIGALFISLIQKVTERLRKT